VGDLAGRNPITGISCRTRRERPRGGRAAEKRDELASSDASCRLIPTAGGVVRPNDSTR
jgi:hypothetical protein